MPHSQSSPQSSDIKQDKMLKIAHEVLSHYRDDQMDISYCLEEDDFYLYQMGVWAKTMEVPILSRATGYVPQLLKFPFFTRRQVIENLKLLNYNNLSDFNNAKLMNLENAMVDPITGESYPHGKDYLSTIRIPYRYTKDATCELWLKTLSEILENNQDKIDLLQEFFGYCLTNDVRHKKALLLLGESDSGKSTILNVLRDMLGHENAASVPLKYLSNQQYTPMLVGKLANIDPDVGRDAVNFEPDFKIITSGEPVNCNQKYTKTFTFIPVCKIVLAANIFPNITDHSSAFYTRLIIVPCDRVFGESEKDRDLSKKLKLELPGVLNWSIEGLRRLNARGYFDIKGFSVDAVQELRELNNPIDLFIKDHIAVENDEQIAKDELYNIYKQWCLQSQVGALSCIRFNKVIYTKFLKHTEKDSRSSIGDRPRIWRNLKLIRSVLPHKNMGWQDDNV